MRRAASTVLIALVACWLISTGAPPYLRAQELSVKASELRRDIQREEEHQQELLKQTQELQTTRGEQNAARIYGWALKGEIAIDCPKSSSPLSRESDASISAVPVEPRPPLLQRLHRAFEW